MGHVFDRPLSMIDVVRTTSVTVLLSRTRSQSAHPRSKYSAHFSILYHFLKRHIVRLIKLSLITIIFTRIPFKFRDRGLGDTSIRNFYESTIFEMIRQ